MNDKKSRIYIAAWYFFVFGFLYIWFSQIHPLVLYDSDDWSFASYIRRGIPMWRDWNPSRVLPETLMPMVCSGAVYLLYPLTGDYMGAVTVGSAVVVSIFITVYLYCFTQMIKRAFSLPEEISVSISAFFLLLHFLAMRSEESSNRYMFYCWDLTCYYFYLIPSLLNASLVMYMTKNERFDALWSTGGNNLRKGLFLLALYLAIFSNLPASGILAAFAGGKVLFAIINQIKNKKNGNEFLKPVMVYLGILLLWLVSAVFELSGGRAASAGDNGVPFLQAVEYVVETLSHPTVYCGKAFMAIAFSVILVAAIRLVIPGNNGKQSREFISVFLFFGVCGAAMLVYFILLVAKVDYWCAYRSEYLFGPFFYLFLLVTLALGYSLKRCPNGVILLPAVLYVMLTCTNTVGQTYKESNMENIPADVCIQVGNDLVGQFIQADKAGAEHLELYVPVSQKELNWPFFSGYNGFAIADTLYEHGIITRRIEFTVVPTLEMNEKYNLGTAI